MNQKDTHLSKCLKLYDSVFAEVVEEISWASVGARVVAALFILIIGCMFYN